MSNDQPISSFSITVYLAVIMASTFSSVLVGDQAVAKDRISGPIPAIIERVVDGDTVKVTAKIWLEQELKVSVRIADINAPELFRPKCPAEKERAYEAKAFVQSFFADNQAWLYEIESGKYAGRVVAKLTNSQGKDLGDALLAANHAVAYKRRGPWCS